MVQNMVDYLVLQSALHRLEEEVPGALHGGLHGAFYCAFHAAFHGAFHIVTQCIVPRLAPPGTCKVCTAPVQEVRNVMHVLYR